MFSLKSIWRTWSGDWDKPPQRDENYLVVDSLMLELEFHVHDLEKLAIQQELEEHRRKAGVDYSWLVSQPRKAYEIPQLERFELEDLCYQVKPNECSKIMALFRDSVLNKPSVHNLPRILKACVKQVLDQRPKEESLSEWVTKKTFGLINIKLRPRTKVSPSGFEESDLESQNMVETICSRVVPAESRLFYKSFSLPYFGRRETTDLPV